MSNQCSEIKLREISGYPNYLAGPDGSIWSRRKKIGNRWVTAEPTPMDLTIHHDGYRYVTLYRDGKARSRKVSVIIAETFIGPKPETNSGDRNVVIKTA